VSTVSPAGSATPLAGRGPARLPRVKGRVSGRLGLLDRPLTSYYLVLGITMLLLALGLVMVLSTSSAAALDSGGSPYAGFQKQLLGVAIGLPLMWLAARSSPAVFRAAAYPLLTVSVIGLLLAITIGVPNHGAARWVQLGPLAPAADPAAAGCRDPQHAGDARR
jgi:cell division protein FtsW